MTPDEREQLTRFLHLLCEARAGAKDPEAEGLVRDACARQPDAAYLLAQHALQVEAALLATQAQVADLQKQLAAARPAPQAGSFLSENSWGRQPAAVGASAAMASTQPASASFQPAMARGMAPAAQQPMAAAAPARSWGSGGGMLGTLAMTAAGVAGGALLYQGISGMMNRNNADQAKDNSSVPPGAGTLDTANRYGDSAVDSNADGGYMAEDFDTGDSGGGDSSDVG